MVYDVNWFENNMKPVFIDGLGDCSACCLRNLDKKLFCEKLTCSNASCSSFVFWTTKNLGLHRELLMGLPPKDMIEWFDKTPFVRVRRITNNVINKALQNQKQNVK